MKNEIHEERTPWRIDDFYASGDSRITSLVLPDGVNEIGMGAFSLASRLRTVRLPDSLRIIGTGAFRCCPELNELFIPAGIVEMRGSFSENPKLTRITVDDSDGLHLDGAFLIREDILIRVFPSLCSEKELFIPNGIRRISGAAFAQCHKLESIHLPESLRIIEGGAFAGCRSLSRVTIPEGVEEIGDGAFFGDLVLQELNLPDSTKKIGDWCCDGCSSLRRAVIPAHALCPATAFPPSCQKELRGPSKTISCSPLPFGIREIAPYAFAEAPDLEEITIPESVVRIGECAFQRIPKLKKIRLPRSLKVIERNAFADLPKLEEIILPDAVTEIPQGCFWNCRALRHVTFPRSLRMINRYAFRDCTALEYVKLPDGIVSLVSGAFQGCSNLRGIDFPQSLRVIGGGDFVNPKMEFPGVFEHCVSLREVRLPAELDLLNDNTFLGCISLKQVQMPGRIRVRGKNIFAECPGVQIIENPRCATEIQPEWVRKLQSFRSMKIGFLFALAEEAGPFARVLGMKEIPPLHQTVSHNENCLLICGPGRANASIGTIQLFRAGCQTIVNIGTAGAYRIQEETRVFAPGTVFDGDAFLGNSKEALWDPAGINSSCNGKSPPVITVSGFARSLCLPIPALIDNEAYAIAATSYALGLKSIFFKIASDHADTDAPEEFHNALNCFSDFIDDVGTLLIRRLEELSEKKE